MLLVEQHERREARLPRRPERVPLPIAERLEPRAALGEITTGAKALQFQLARAMARKRPLDLAPLDGLAARWDAAMGALVRDFG